MSEPSPEILDLSYLRRQTAGDEALERELLGLLLSQCAALAGLLSSPDEPTRREAAHGLRGAASALGANRLAATAAAIESGVAPPAPIGDVVEEVRSAVGCILGREAA